MTVAALRCHAVTRTGSKCGRAGALVHDKAGRRRFGGAPLCKRHARIFSRPGGAGYTDECGRAVSWRTVGGWLR